MSILSLSASSSASVQLQFSFAECQLLAKYLKMSAIRERPECYSKIFGLGHRQEERPDLPVSLLMVLHALRLEFEKSMELTASSYRSCFFCCSSDRRDVAALLESVPIEALMKRISNSLSQHGAYFFRRPRGIHCLAEDSSLSPKSGMCSQCLVCPEVAISQRNHL